MSHDIPQYRNDLCAAKQPKCRKVKGWRSPQAGSALVVVVDQRHVDSFVADFAAVELRNGVTGLLRRRNPDVAHIRVVRLRLDVDSKNLQLSLLQ